MPHKPDKDRLIFDRRPQNFEEARLGWAKLPNGSQLTRIIVRDDQHLRGSGDDLRTYFYNLAQLDEQLPRNAFGRKFIGAGCEEFGASPDKHFYLALRVIAMGDLNAVDVAQ